MKKIFCLIAAFSVLLPLALSAQAFNPAGGPLEGVWETEDEGIIIVTGNLMLKGEKDGGGSFYDIMPGMVYRNGEAFGPEEYDIMFDYELSGNTLKILMGDVALICTKSRNDILRNKGPLEGIWKGEIFNSDTAETIVWIITGGLLIEAAGTGSYLEYWSGLEFVYSAADDTLIGLGETISCVVSGDTMTITNDSRTAVLIRER
jgi:hypothetical protein